VTKFKRAALPVADQVTNASVISKDCQIVSLGLIFTAGSRVVICFNAANHKQAIMMREGRIVFFKMWHNRGMKGVSMMALVRPSFATVTKVATFAL
jgi:uncharacterized protein (DUF1786 family)